MGSNKGNIFSEDLIPSFAWLGSSSAQTDLVFSNDTGTLTLFTVTGDVIVKVIPVVTVDVASAAAANVELGVVGDTDALIASTVATALDAREIWHDANPDSEVEALSVAREFIVTDGNNVILTLSAQVDSGAITFYCYWTPLSSDGNVVRA